MGFGVKKGPIMFDLGFSFRNGMWLHTMKGFNFSFGFTYIGKNKEKKKTDKVMPQPRRII
jgi:hypothetical protein